MQPESMHPERRTRIGSTVQFADPSPYLPAGDSLLTSLRLRAAYRLYRRIVARNGRAAPGTHLVDIGCGPGFLVRFLSEWFPQAGIIAGDYDARLLAFGRQRCPGISFTRLNAEQLPLESRTADVLFCLHLLEHLYHPEAFFGEAARVLKHDGALVVATPNPVGIGARVMKSRWHGYREDHVSLKSPAEWLALAETSGFKPLRWGTTGLSGIPAFRKLPLNIANYLALYLWGMFPWDKGEAFIGVFRSGRHSA